MMITVWEMIELRGYVSGSPSVREEGYFEWDQMRSNFNYNARLAVWV